MDFIGPEQLSVRGQAHEITAQTWFCSVNQNS